MNTEVTQTLGVGEKQDLARYEYRSHTNSRRGRKTGLVTSVFIPTYVPVCSPPLEFV
jgi:hypothetical protein